MRGKVASNGIRVRLDKFQALFLSAINVKDLDIGHVNIGVGE